MKQDIRRVTAYHVLLALPAACACAAQSPEGLPVAPTVSVVTTRQATAAPNVSYKDGQLRIDMAGSTLGEILSRVAALTGMALDLPESAKNERTGRVQLGPGPAREVVTSLLSDSNFDYLILASAADPTKIQSVLLMQRDRKGAGPNGMDSPSSIRSPFARLEAAPVRPEPQASDNQLAPPAERATSDTGAANAQAAAAQPDPSSVPAEDLTASPSHLTPPKQDASTIPRPVPLTPSQLTPTIINQTLQQMYQQRMQLNQQNQNLPLATTRE